MNGFRPLNAWVLIDKPLGPTSTLVTHKVRRHFKAAKAGHGGTLDPLASGLLPIALNEATKTIPFIMDAQKTYTFTIKWGQGTTTDDAEGEVIETSAERPTKEAIIKALPLYTGIVTQVPPAYSAIKIDGERSYALARKGQAVKLPSRQIKVYDFRLLSIPDGDQASFEVTCSKGTYVRSLGRDLARSLGTVGHLTVLRRTRIGMFDVAHAISLDNLTDVRHSAAERDGFLVSIPQALADIPALLVEENEEQDLRFGRPLVNRWRNEVALQEGQYALCLTCQGREVALVVRHEGNLLSPRRVFVIKP